MASPSLGYEIEALRRSLGVMCMRTDRLQFANARLSQENVALRSCLAAAEQRAAEALAVGRIAEASRLPIPRRFAEAEDAAMIGYIWEDAGAQDSPCSSLHFERPRGADSPRSPLLRRPLPPVPRSWLEEDDEGLQSADRAFGTVSEITDVCPTSRGTTWSFLAAPSSWESVRTAATADRGTLCEATIKPQADRTGSLAPLRAPSPQKVKAAARTTSGGILCDPAFAPAESEGNVWDSAGSLRDVTNLRLEGGLAAWARARPSPAPRCAAQAAAAAVPEGGRPSPVPPAPRRMNMPPPVNAGHERSSHGVARMTSASGLRAASPLAQARSWCPEVVPRKASPVAVVSCSSFVPPAARHTAERPTPRPVLLGSTSLRTSPAKKTDAARPPTAQSCRPHVRAAHAPAVAKAIAAKRAAPAAGRQSPA